MTPLPQCDLCGLEHASDLACPTDAPRVGETMIRPAVPVTRDALVAPQPAAVHSPGSTVLRPALVSETMAGLMPAPPPIPAPSPAMGMATVPPESPLASDPYLPPAPPEQFVGEMVGSFKLVKLLGKGGMGAVYLGEHPGIGSKVAIKMLHPMLAARPDLVKRFYDEARAVNLIGHENIVSIFDLNQLPPNRYYIVMEALEGRTLAELIKEGPVKLETSADILIQLCDALDAAHKRAIVHRDLKPENVFLIKRGTRENFVKLVDFGIAKLRDESGPANQTATGVLVGTPEYMSPEQADNKPVDARSDIYALGCIAYRLFAGRLPFQEKSIGRLIAAHLLQQPASPREFNPSLPVSAELAVLQALSKKPDERFQSVGEFAAAIREAITPPVVVTPAPVAATPPPVVATPPPVIPPPPRVTPAEQPRVIADFDVDLLEPMSLPKLHVADVSRGGLFLCTSAAPPALFSQVKLSLPRAGGGRIDVAGEVVRHVSQTEARAWGMDPGFGVQFVSLSAEHRAVLAELTARRPSASLGPGRPPSVAAPLDPDVGRMLTYLSERFNANHYDLLGVAPDVEIKLVGPAAKSLEDRIRIALDRAEAAHHPQLQTGMDRARAALETLGNASRRIDYDAHRGNFRGVARCLESGFPLLELANRHKAFLAQRPGLEVRSQQMLGRIKVARGRANYPAALREYEAALVHDPLNPDLQRGWHEVVILIAKAAAK